MREAYMQHITTPIKHTVGTFIQCDNKFLTLLRTDNTWGLASGGIEKGETAINAALREIFEETGLIVLPKDLKKLGTVHIQLDDLKVIYPTFFLCVDEPFPVVLDLNEHTDYKWVTLDECREMNLIQGFHQILDEVYENDKKSL